MLVNDQYYDREMSFGLKINDFIWKMEGLERWGDENWVITKTQFI